MMANFIYLLFAKLGKGINVEEFERIVEKGATSKLNVFEDLNKIQTYGFRGEALNAVN